MNLSYLKPFGVVIDADPPGVSVFNISCKFIEELVKTHKVVVLRGFALLRKKDFESFARGFGDLLEWEFGNVLDIKLESTPANHIFSSGRVELHWDGAFVDKTPKLNLFQCLKSNNDENQGGETIFVDTAKLWKESSREQQQIWKRCVINYKTEKKAHYGGSIRVPLVENHPTTLEKILRFIEPFNEDNVNVNPVEVTVNGIGEHEQESFLRQFTTRLYHNDVMYRHRWRKGDFVFVDNLGLLHGRTRFTSKTVDRHLQRIHIL